MQTPGSLVPLVLVAAVAVIASACGGAQTPRADGGSVTAVGSSFVYPLVSQWIPAIRERDGIDVTYSPSGSGAGIEAITKRTADLGATDAPLSEGQLRACDGCVQVPWALSATSIAYNLPDATDSLRLTGEVLAGMYLGDITRWDDPAIARLNPGVDLPVTPVTPVFRSDNSGTAFTFTDFLSRISPAWRQRVGVGTNVAWPTGVGARGSSGVTGIVGRTPGALTFVDVAYAQESSLATALVRNAAGRFVGPTLEGVAGAAASVDVGAIPGSGAISIVSPPADHPDAYPISTFTYAVFRPQGENATTVAAFLRYAIDDGQDAGPPLLFQPLPDAIRTFAASRLG